MRLRLFWKILWGFWVTWIVTTVVSLATLLIFVPQMRVILNTRQVVVQAQHQRERELTVILRYGGEQTLTRVEALLTPPQRADIRIVDRGPGRQVVFPHPPP